MGFQPGGRVLSREILDEGIAAPADVRESLADLRRVNRWLGGRRVLRLLIAEQVRRAGLRQFTMLDAGTGSGDLPEFAAERFGARVVGVDRLSHHMTLLRESSKNGWMPVAAEILSLPFRPRTFDLVCASLVLHHFDDDTAVEALRAMAAVAHHAVLVNDLERNAIAWRFIRYSPFARNRISRLDGAASVQQAFTAAELETLARRAGFQRFRVRRHIPFRLSLAVELS